jgi:antitoxin (DNA-binding transcriptional repressor) of toxin-antitoxin stability system
MRQTIMKCVTLEDAQTHLSELIAKLQPGEEVQIMSGQQIVARIIGTTTATRQPRRPGSAIGTLKILADDEEHLQDFQNYMP